VFLDNCLTFVSTVTMLQNALDKNGRTALDLCENINQHDWQSAASLLRIAMSRPVSALFSTVTQQSWGRMHDAVLS